MFDIAGMPDEDHVDPLPEDVEAFGRFAGSMAHEFNNLLTAILGHAVLCRAQVSRKDPIDQDLARIEDASQRAADLARRLMATSRAVGTIRAEAGNRDADTRHPGAAP